VIKGKLYSTRDSSFVVTFSARATEQTEKMISRGMQPCRMGVKGHCKLYKTQKGAWFILFLIYDPKPKVVYWEIEECAEELAIGRIEARGNAETYKKYVGNLEKT
jgi:hypothetical protein